MQDNFKLDFLIVGFQKYGTSTLADFLSVHPEVNFCITKEPAIFIPENIHKVNILEDLFMKNKAGLKGEASTAYGFIKYSEFTSKHLTKYFPDLRIIFIVRNPVNRVLSLLRHAQLNNKDLENTPNRKKILSNAIDNSKYFEVISTYLKEFDLSSILIVTMDKLINGDGIYSVCDFLGISKELDLTLKKVNFTLERNVKPSWFKYYEKYQFMILKLPFSKIVRRFGKVILSSIPSQKKVEFTHLSNSETDMILNALHSDRKLFMESFGIDYFKLVK